jgi:hypothetical protein
VEISRVAWQLSSKLAAADGMARGVEKTRQTLDSGNRETKGAVKAYADAKAQRSHAGRGGGPMDDSEKLAETLRRIEEQMKEFEEAFKLLKAELDRIQQDLKDGSQQSSF